MEKWRKNKPPILQMSIERNYFITMRHQAGGHFETFTEVIFWDILLTGTGQTFKPGRMVGLTIRCLSIHCVLLSHQWKQSLRPSSMQVGDTWSLKCSIARVDRQTRKFHQFFIITEKKLISLCANQVGLSIRNSEIL